jgi:hypothetical protein
MNTENIKQAFNRYIELSCLPSTQSQLVQYMADYIWNSSIESGSIPVLQSKVRQFLEKISSEFSYVYVIYNDFGPNKLVSDTELSASEVTHQIAKLNSNAIDIVLDKMPEPEQDEYFGSYTLRFLDREVVYMWNYSKAKKV